MLHCRIKWLKCFLVYSLDFLVLFRHILLDTGFHRARLCQARPSGPGLHQPLPQGEHQSDRLRLWAVRKHCLGRRRRYGVGDGFWGFRSRQCPKSGDAVVVGYIWCTTVVIFEDSTSTSVQGLVWWYHFSIVKGRARCLLWFGLVHLRLCRMPCLQESLSLFSVETLNRVATHF